MKKIAIIGANSNVGRHLINYLINTNSYEIVRMARHNSDCDINLLDSVDDIQIPKGIDILVLLAASMNQNTDKSIVEMVETNTLGPLKICMAAKRAGIKQVIIMSSIFSKIKKENIYYNYYGITKDSGEKLVKYYCKENSIDLCILRPSQIYGTDKSFSKHQQFFYFILENVKNNKDIMIYGSHDPVRNFIHIDDVIDVVYRVIESSMSGEFDICGTNITISEIAKIAIECCKSGSKVIFDSTKANLEDNGFEPSDSIRRILHKETYVTLQEGIRRFYDEKC